MNVFSEYSQPTVEFVWSLLKEAYEDEDKLDKLLAETADEVFAEVKEILLDMEKSGKIDMSKKIRLSEHPAIYRALKDIECNEWYKFTEWCWIGYQVITESLTRSYRNTVLWTYDTFKPKILTTTSSLKPFDVEVKITDTYITNHCLKIPWCQDGKTYSDRLWGNVANFQSKLSFVLEQGITRGKGMDWMMQAWKKLTHTAGYEVARLLKTETMAMWSQATKESYLSLGIEYVEIIGDAECGGICLDYVGEAIPLREAELGDELPPYHPNCACSYIAYEEEKEIETFEEEFEEE